MRNRSFRIGRRSLVMAVLALSAGCVQISLAEQIAALLREARALLAAKRYDEAIGKFTQVVKADGKQWPAYLGLAQAFIGKGDWKGAIDNGRQAYQLSPQGGEVVTTLAQALLGGGLEAVRGSRWNDAVGYLGDYLKLQPNDTNGYLQIGRAFLGNRQYGQALDAFVKGLGQQGGGAQRGDLLKGLFDGGMQAYQANDYRGAIGFLSEYVKTDSGNLDAYLNLAKAYWNAGDRSQAIGAFTNVLRISPTNSEALRFMLQR